MTDEQIAAALYPRAQPAQPVPAPPLSAVEEEPVVPEPQPSTRVRGLLAENDRLMQLLEADIDQLDAQLRAQEAEAERNLAAED